MSEVRNILEARAKRTLGVVPEQGDPLESAQNLARTQVNAAQQLLTRDLSKAPRWAWSYLDLLTGPMLPGELVIVGSLMGNGKSTLLMSQMDAFAFANIPTLYFPLEVDPEICRVRWASWRLDLPSKHVVRQEWGALGHGAQGAVDRVLEEQKSNPCIHFATPKRITLGGLVKWCQWARREFDAKVVMLDHFHRMDVGVASQNHRVALTDVVRQLKDVARDLGLVLIAAAQLNRSSDPIDAYTPPLLSRLKETSALGEEADVVLMLSRKLRRDLPDSWQQMLRVGQLTEPELAEANRMVVTCRKHRLDESAMNGRVVLTVDRGRVVG